MTTRDEAVRSMAGHLNFKADDKDGVQSFTCECGTVFWTDDELIEPPETCHAAHLAGVLAAAGLLRPDPTREDREALAGTAYEAFLSLIHPETTRADIRHVSLALADDLLAAGFSRPRGPVTETPAGATMARSNPTDSVLGDMGEWGRLVDDIVVGSDGLTDAERDALAQRHAETVARDRTADEVFAARLVAGSLAAMQDKYGAVGPAPEGEKS